MNWTTDHTYSAIYVFTAPLFLLGELVGIIALQKARTVKQEITVKSFEKCGISTALYHTEDPLLFVRSGNLNNNNSNDTCHNFKESNDQ